MNLAQVGWLDDLTNWIRGQVERFWNALVDLVADTLVSMFEMVLNAFALAVESIPVPDWLSQYSLDGLFALLPADLIYFVNLFRVDEAIGLIGLGYVVRLVRKLLTLGQW